MAVATEACAHAGCKNTKITRCAYVDRRHRECGYSWCQQHSIVLGDRSYCRRHGGVMRAINAIPYEEVEPPDLDNRALSLCEWVSADIDADIRGALEGHRPNQDSWVYAQPLTLVMQRPLGTRGWSRGWSLANQTGVLRKVGLYVDESDDSTVIATVDAKELTHTIPPWISDRGTPISEEAIARRRAEFRQKLVDQVKEALDLAETAQPA